ncbi:uncharacterized protein LOC143231973 isoform X1 [Tachypleus tridentatus]|uniref:uncharacterized protein LOC143231973 isoform X1 n=2 Tax=Tachypleus tridentatus TaxID=6853 RepID=UPI003FD02D56
MLEITNGVVSPSLFNNNLFNKSILGGLSTLCKDLSKFISLSSTTETPRTSKLKKTSSPTTIMSHINSPLNKKKTKLVDSHPFPSKQSSFMSLLANSYGANRSSRFRVFKSSVIHDIKPSFVVPQERVIKSVTSKETSLIGDKSHKSSFLSKKDSSMETPFTKEGKVLIIKATNKSIGEAIQVKPINVSMTTKTGREETLAAAGSIKTSPQYFIPFKFAYISLKLGTDWSEFCTGKEFIRKEIADLISKKGNSVEFNQIVFFDILGDCRAVFDKKNNFTTFRDGEGRFIQISLFLLNKNGHYDFNLTETCGALLKSGANDIKNTIYDRKVYRIQVEFRTKDERPYTKPLSPGNRRVITVMSVAGVCVLAVILAIIRHRHKQTSKCEQRHQEDNSLDCFHTITNNQQKEFQFSARSFLNQAFDEPDMLSHSVDSTVLTSFSCNYEAMEDEFKSIPMNMSRRDQIPTWGRN